MEDYLKNAISTLEYGAAKVQENMLHIINQEAINELLKCYETNPNPPKNTPAAMYFSVRSLYLSRYILERINKLPDKLCLEDVIYFGMALYNTGFATGTALPAMSLDGYKILYETHGSKFFEAGKQPKRDALSIVIEEIVQKHLSENNKLPEYQDVIRMLKRSAKAGHTTIQEVKNKTIYWKRKSGQEKQTSYKQLQNRLTRIREKLSVPTG